MAETGSKAMHHVYAMNRYHADLETLLNGPEPPELVCFDYFDTLVARSVYPEATKKLAAKHLNALLAGTITDDTIYHIRAALEKKLCEKSGRAGFDLEFTLVDLAEEMFAVLATLGVVPQAIDKKKFCELFGEIELATECNCQELLPGMIDMLELVRAKNIPLCLVSDFYLPAELFRRMLAHQGVEHFFDNIFVSADYGVSKGGSGRLYGVVARKMEVAPQRMLMIGDNPHADMAMAKKAGLSVLGLDRQSIYDRYAGWAQDKDGQENEHRRLIDGLQTVLKNHKPECFGEMGLSLWLFTHELFAQLQQDGVTEVFFCSKEGEFLRTLFQRYQQLRFGRQIISARYLLVSRKATFIASLAPLEEEDFAGLFHGYRDLSLEEFLLSLNFRETEAGEILKILGLDGGVRHQNLPEQEIFSTLITNEEFVTRYETHRSRQKKNLRAYLNSFTSIRQDQRLALVDVGWKGSIQNNIYRTLGGEVNVCGYYLGLLSPTGVTGRNTKKGILFHDVPKHSDFIHVYNNNRSLFEMVLGASHGSADGYFTPEEWESDTTTVQRMRFQGEDGPAKIVVAVVDLPEERDLFVGKIEPIQKKIATMHEQITALYCRSLGDLPGRRWFAENHARMVFFPTQKEVAFFSELYHLENFGLFEFTLFDAQQRIGPKQRLVNLLHLMKHRSAVLETGVWQPVILRRLGLGFLQRLDGRRRRQRIFGSK